MGQVILSLEEYDQLRKQADGKKELSNCFELKKDYSGELRLSIEVSKAQEIFKTLFTGSKFDNGTYVINEKECDYSDDIANYYINATKKDEIEVEETEEDEENGN
ncbi:MAG: hypothetical protein AB9856_20730 [Cellulosilyticaceae bacterium]